MLLNMRLNNLVISALAGALLLFSAGSSFAQGTLHRQVPQSETTDSSGNLKIKDGSEKTSQQIRGVVTLSSGAPAEEIVGITAACPTFSRLLAVTDSKGRFSFGFDQQRQADAELTKGCTIYASLSGYRSETLNFAALNSKASNAIKLVLQPISAEAAGISSASDGKVSEGQKAAYRKALDKASKQDWKGASAALAEVVAASPGYSSALLSLGICLQNMGSLAAAEKAYLDAAGADPQFALPLIRAAAIESAAGNMQDALTHSEKAIELNPGAFPDAYAINAIANISAQKTDAAEKSARAGLALDAVHQYPELEYALGMVLYVKNDSSGAAGHFRKYIEESPNGPNVATAKNQLAQMPTVNAGTVKVAAAADAQLAGPAIKSTVAGALPTSAELQRLNAPLLTDSEAYTCLESVMPAKLDPRGRPTALDTVRVDIAVSGGKEIYGAADGKHFSNGAQRDLLGYTFSTTGLFSSIARSLIAANQFAIEPAGEVVIKGQILLRYNFSSLPTTAGWLIGYGKESGTASEQGWFLIDRESKILRRVFVAAVRIPANLKLVNLNALIDYQAETVAGRRVLLPSVARMEVGERSGIKHMSLLSFDHCRAFTAESGVSFDDVDNEGQVNKPMNPMRLPVNMELLVSLNSTVSVATAEQSDVVTATVAKAVMQNGRELIKAGAVIEGHVRPNRGDNSLVMQFDRVQTATGWVPFYAQLLKLGSSAAQVEGLGGNGKLPVALLKVDSDTALAEPDIPGVATIAFASKEAELSTGTQMIWRTQPLLVEHTEGLVPQLNTSMGLH